MATLPPTREAMACAIGALIVDDPREFNAWMTQGVVLLRQQAQAAKDARRPRGVMVEDGAEEQSSGIPTDSGDDAHAAWFARRHGGLVPPQQYEAQPQQVPDPNLAALVQQAVMEYMRASGTQLAPLSPPATGPYGPAGYAYPGHYSQPVLTPPLPPARPNFWYDPRRR